MPSTASRLTTGPGWRSSPRRWPALAAIALAFGPWSARADVVTDWNAIALDTFKAANVGGNPMVRGLAIVHVAMSDAVNTVQNRYTRHALSTGLVPAASADAAAVAAAHGVLVGLAASQKARLDAAYLTAMNAVADAPAWTSGVAIGQQAAAAAIADRANDDTTAADVYRPVTAPGVWVPTAPPLFAQYARAKPWVFSRPDQFRPGPPPALTSAAYARDFNETKELGGARSSRRTQQQTDAVRFWSQANLNSAWFEAARQLAAAARLELADNARLFALLSMAAANSYIVDWDAKFHYNFWRPVTAIRNGDLDGNDATERDAGWTALAPVPLHPEYPSQAAIFGSVSTAVFQALLGPVVGMRIVVTDNADPTLTRSFENLAAMVEETRSVRIWGGIHFRSSLEASDALGRRVVDHMVAQSIRPVR